MGVGCAGRGRKCAGENRKKRTVRVAVAAVCAWHGRLIGTGVQCPAVRALALVAQVHTGDLLFSWGAADRIQLRPLRPMLSLPVRPHSR